MKWTGPLSLVVSCVTLVLVVSLVARSEATAELTWIETQLATIEQAVTDEAQMLAPPSFGPSIEDRLAAIERALNGLAADSADARILDVLNRICDRLGYVESLVSEITLPSVGC
ncbi:MAG: hypothetical protein M5T61_17565 [Acidimicrobiia bacterium]|nr:hypothetical protein [Acidimicrobiia bacterium]